MKIQAKKGEQMWELSDARLSMTVDPVSGLSLFISANLEIDGVRVADYGFVMSGDKATEFYAGWKEHIQLYEAILQDAGVQAVIPPEIENEYKE